MWWQRSCSRGLIPKERSYVSYPGERIARNSGIAANANIVVTSATFFGEE
jgi:hypothetical protein